MLTTVIGRTPFKTRVLGANTILSDFYVDDLLTDASTLEELLTNRRDVVDIFNKCGFELHKWALIKKYYLILDLLHLFLY